MPTLTQSSVVTHRSAAQLKTLIADYLNIYNQGPKPFLWTKTADQILDDTLKTDCRVISDAEH